MSGGGAPAKACATAILRRWVYYYQNTAHTGRESDVLLICSCAKKVKEMYGCLFRSTAGCGGCGAGWTSRSPLAKHSRVHSTRLQMWVWDGKNTVADLGSVCGIEENKHSIWPAHGDGGTGRGGWVPVRAVCNVFSVWMLRVSGVDRVAKERDISE